VPTEEIAISSSEIRQRVSENQSIQGLVPATVEVYIHDRGLYTQQAP
jgi:nicotinic acid mononucleotide adenylyltransferase